MAPRPLRKQWRRALKTNLTRVAGLLRRRGPLNAAAVHDLRVALRRVRLLLQLCGKHQDRDRRKRYRIVARKIMDAFAPPRDADVTLEWARQMHASPALLTHLMHERTRQCRRAERALKHLKLKLRATRLKAPGKEDAEKLNRRFLRWMDAIAASCRTSIQHAERLSVPELHALRRDVRRWRYLRELASNCRPVTRDRIVRGLVAAQEALGAIQDTEVILQQMTACGRSGEVTRFKQLLRRELELNRLAALEQISRLKKHPAFRQQT